MNDNSHPAGKISVHGNGFGAPSPDEVEKRAREIALIAEREPDEFTDADWNQARRELLGAQDSAAPEETESNADVVEEWNVVAASKWHLAHTSWFFETFIVKVWMPRYRPEVPQYAYLFNSYYNAAGNMHRRDLRGLISRPTVAETYRFRESIDQCVGQLLAEADEATLNEIEPILILGLNHEQQHQELLLTDIKHVLAQNPLYPVFAVAGIDDPGRPENDDARKGPGSTIPATAPQRFIEFDEAISTIGHDGNGFSYDNEGPQHRALVSRFTLSNG